VALDVAKQAHEVLIEPPAGGRQRWRMVNCPRDFDVLRQRLEGFCRHPSSSDLKPPAPITGRLRTFCINAGLSSASFPL